MAKQIKLISSTDKVSVKELMELVPEELIDDLVEQFKVDKWVRTLKAGYFFKLILFSILNSERISLRILEGNFEDPLFRALAPAVTADEVTWNGIRERLRIVKCIFFQKLYEAVYKRAQALYGGQRLSGYHIKKYDSTMIATFSHLLEGMKVGNTKKGKTQVKLTTEFRDDFLIQMNFHQDQAHLSEETALKEIIQELPKEEEDIHVFDRGLKSRATFDLMQDEGTLFVTRLDYNARFELLRPYRPNDFHSDNEEIEFVQDSVVKLFKGGKNNPTKNEFRLLEFSLKKDGKRIFFLTNVWDIDAADIAYIYKKRWDIEVLFRFMKQEMNLTHFVCNEPNAIQVMLYCTMIASMLVLIYKKQNGIKSYKKAKIQFFKELLYLVLFEALENPDELNRLKNNLKKLIQLE